MTRREALRAGVLLLIPTTTIACGDGTLHSRPGVAGGDDAHPLDGAGGRDRRTSTGRSFSSYSKAEGKKLLGRFTPTCVVALERAVDRCVESHRDEVTVEDWLLALFEDLGSDVCAAFRSVALDTRATIAALRAFTRNLPRGRHDKPAIALVLWDVLEDAWNACVEIGSPVVRSGVLLLLFVERSHRYLALETPDLEALPRTRLRTDLGGICATSREGREGRAEIEQGLVSSLLGSEG